MPDTLTTITNLIQSPPGQLAAGGLLAGIVWKFFEKVEGVLTDQTKFEIAVWLEWMPETELNCGLRRLRRRLMGCLEKGT